VPKLIHDNIILQFKNLYFIVKVCLVAGRDESFGISYRTVGHKSLVTRITFITK